MNIAQIETLMYQVSGLLLPPVLMVIALLFFYAFFIFGCFLAQYLQRRNNAHEYQRTVHSLLNDSINLSPVKGYRRFDVKAVSS